MTMSGRTLSSSPEPGSHTYLTYRPLSPRGSEDARSYEPGGCAVRRSVESSY